MFRMFRKPVSVLDEKKQQNNYVIQNHVPDSPKRNAPLVINKVQTYSNVLSIPVKMFFNVLTAWLNHHDHIVKEPSTVTKKEFKTRLMVQNYKKKQALTCMQDWYFFLQEN